MGFASKLVVGGVAAGAALAYYVQKRRARTGEGYVDILRQLPSDAQRWGGDAKQRAALALDDGKAAARQRDSDFTKRLTAAGASGRGRLRRRMPERIDLEVPATLNALSTVRMVLGGLGARLDFSLDDLEDIYLATDELLRTALAADAVDRLRVEVLLDDERPALHRGDVQVRQAARRRDRHAEDCLDLCMLLRRTVDDVVLEDEDGAYRIVLVKQRRGDPA